MTTAEQLRDTEAKAEKRAASRDLIIPEVKDPARRAAAEADDRLWLTTYCADVFYNPFTPHQHTIIADCGEALRYGTQKCKAAPRGDGKTSIVKYLTLKYALCRQVMFPLILCATGDKSKDGLDSVKKRLASRASSPLSEDYPLECHIARYVDPWPSRGRNATANGLRPINVEWGANHIILPTWAENEPLGPIMLALGITSNEIQGCNVYDRRPDFVILDDLDNRDSLASEHGVIAGKIEEAIDKTVAGLGGQSRKLGQFMLCTITSRASAAFKYSDPVQKPSWSGERVAAIQVWPERLDLWETYVELRKWGKGHLDANRRPVDPLGRKAHQFLVDNFDDAHAGAVLSNPHNYERDLLPDGSQKQLSALQRCYDYIADYGMTSFLTEHQNDPPDAGEAVERNIDPAMIQRQVSGLEQGEIPENAKFVVHGVDVGKYFLHWVVRAYKSDGTGFTIDYGRQHVYDTKFKSEEGLDRAIHAAIQQRMAEFRDQPYAKGRNREALTLIDAGYRTDAVYAACQAAGLGVMPVMGFGKSAGCVQMSWSEVTAGTKDRQPICDGAFRSLKGSGKKLWLICANADKWKAWEHDRWLTEQSKPGCMFLYGERSEQEGRLSPDQRAHGHYAQHICAEVEIEDVVKGSLVRRWKSRQKENHWLDASYYCNVAAAVMGLRIVDATPPQRPPRKRPADDEKQVKGVQFLERAGGWVPQR